MRTGAQLAITDLRQGARFPVRHTAMCEHRVLGDIVLQLSNVSRVGFMVDARGGVERGDRLIIRLPASVRIEAFCIWTRHQRAGFQFERPIRAELFAAIVPQMKVAIRQVALND